MMTTRGFAVLFACTALPGAAALGQSRQIPAPPQSRPVILMSATVHTVTGPTIEDGYVIFDDGIILDVGRGPPPAVPRPRPVNAEGLPVSPWLNPPAPTRGPFRRRLGCLRSTPPGSVHRAQSSAAAAWGRRSRTSPRCTVRCTDRRTAQ